MRVGARTYVDFFSFCFDDGYLARFMAGKVSGGCIDGLVWKRDRVRGVYEGYKDFVQNIR
jgi:hypothetical protein